MKLFISSFIKRPAAGKNLLKACDNQNSREIPALPVPGGGHVFKMFDMKKGIRKRRSN
ncbi:MAG: hypothetical protein WDM90_00645 [Ferruginibacter sp.]